MPGVAGPLPGDAPSLPEGGDPAHVVPVTGEHEVELLVAVFGVIFLGERLTTPNWLGVALIAVGAVLVAYR